MAVYCRGCGAKLHSDDPKKPGFVPAEKLSQDDVICQRCFKITHYNQLATLKVDEDYFVEVIKKIGQKRALVVKIVDLFDFEGSWLDELFRLIPNNPVLVAVNKIDLFPPVRWERIEAWVRQRIKAKNVHPAGLVFVSGQTGQGIPSLIEEMKRHRIGKDVYLVGCANVGKSTVINQILQQLVGERDLKITTSRFPGTTLDVIDIPVSPDFTLHDTPGLINPRQITRYVSPDDLKQLLPERKLRPKIYQLNPEQTLFFGGLARLDFLEGERCSFVCYMAERLPIHRTKLKNAEAIYTKHLGGMLTPPGPKTLAKWRPLVKHTFRLEGEGDIVFSGLGWVAVKGSNILVCAHAPQGVMVSMRPVLI